MTNNPINSLSISELFNSGNYVIPIYQRNYAWGEREINQLIQDIFDYAVTDKNTGNYYLGSLVVYERHQKNEVHFETIDGQQRLTTLNILLCVLNREFEDELYTTTPFKTNLYFDSRKKSTDTLEIIARPGELLHMNPNREYNPNILQAYTDAEKTLRRLLSTQEILNQFYTYLNNRVHILRVSVPEDTDLNHYFEIMNSRGEQLEKHEVLKARMMEVLSHDEKLEYTFNTIWEACADMERYVQYGFSVSQRDALFSACNWDQLNGKNLEEIANLIYEDNEDNKQSTLERSILEIISSNESTKQVDTHKAEESPDRFTSVVNFPNFLLHVLRIYTGKDISLDDKRLIELFDVELDQFEDDPSGKLNFVKTFGFSLLKCKWLFDKYIIKREYLNEKDQWSLKRLKWYNGNKVSYVNTFGDEYTNDGANKELTMLLAMFHVSTPTQVYKHWLNAALGFVYQKSNVESEEYIEYLTSLAKAYLYDRYLCKEENKVDFFEIIFKNKGVSKNKADHSCLNLDLLNKGTHVENFIFNLLDFVLWQKKTDGFQQFEYTFRSSIEHYYPRNPIAKDHKINHEICDRFGNLCLISSSKNSKLNNHMPEAKKDYYIKVKPDSLKQKEMMKKHKWEEEEIIAHGKEMTDLLLQF